MNNYLRTQNIFDQYGMGGDYGMGGMPPYQDYAQPPTQDPFQPYPPKSYPTLDAPIGPPSAPMIPQQAAPQVSPNYIDLMNQMYSPETAATKRYDDLLAAYPQRERPSLGRTLVASGMGFSGNPENALKFMELPNLRKTADWNAQIQPAYNAANLERQSNMNERQLAGQFAQHQIASDKNEATDRTNQMRAETDRIRGEAYALKTAGYQLDFSGPFVVATKPGQMPQVTSIPTGKMTENDRILLQNQGRTDVQTLQNEGNLAVQGSRNAGAANVATINSQGDIEQARIDNSGGTGSMSPAETARHRNNVLQEVWDTRQDMRKFLVRNGNNFELIERPTPGTFTGVSGNDLRLYDQLVATVYPNRPGIGPSNAQTPAPAPRGPQGFGLGPSISPVQSGPSAGPQGAARGPQLPPQYQQDKWMQPPGTPEGRVPIYDKQGNLLGHILNTPEQRAAAAAQGLVVR